MVLLIRIIKLFQLDQARLKLAMYASEKTDIYCYYIHIKTKLTVKLVRTHPPSDLL